MGTDLIQISPAANPQPGNAAAELCSPGSICRVQPETYPTSDPAGAKTFFIETFGCQMNVHDSEKVAGVLMARGYRPIDDHREADLVLYNTCSIREKAAQKVYSHLGQLRKVRQKKPPIIGVLGCVAQQEGERIFERAPQVSLVCGSASYSRFGDLVAQLEGGDRRVTGLLLDIDECFETEFTRRDNPFRAYITIIEGCDKRCSFCVVPMTRGPERSRASDGILADCRRLAEEGFTEIQLLGQTVNSYCDPSPERLSFAELLLKVAEVKGVRRVRFTTSHPVDFTADIVRAIESTPALCDQIHLPVQCGSNSVLARMRRNYTREEYLAKIDCIRRAKRAISISTDIIVGFCGETEEDLGQTLSLLDTVEYDQVFSFKYSPRPIAPAGQWPDDVPEEEKTRRLAVLQERQRQIQLRRNQALVGREFEVLVEGYQPRLQQSVGRTTSNRTVNFAGSPDWVGRYMNVRITAAGPNSLVGEKVE
ncbi:MAG: tRNA (N6-isopentenyl adenosine(37)-C2)-methylthiotransferase MiaB [Terriglobia bacterium]|jgi:tRNA-2-methylthio-N6-dimethylallyladenosine synthase